MHLFFSRGETQVNAEVTSCEQCYPETCDCPWRGPLGSEPLTLRARGGPSRDRGALKGGQWPKPGQQTCLHTLPPLRKLLGVDTYISTVGGREGNVHVPETLTPHLISVRASMLDMTILISPLFKNCSKIHVT